MQQSYTKRGFVPPDLEPIVIGLPGEVYNILAVPEADAVGTIDIGNAFEVLEFKGNAVEPRTVKKDYLEEVSGDFIFCFTPTWSKDKVAYTQTRGLTLIDVKTDEVRLYDLCSSLDDQIGGLGVIDAQSETFLLEVLKPHWDDQAKYLQSIRIDADSFQVLGKVPAGIREGTGYKEPWFCFEGKVFASDDSTTSLRCYNEQMQPAQHPISTIFNRNSKNFRRLYQFATHPSLKFGVAFEVGKRIDWKKVNDAQAEKQDSVQESLSDYRHALWLLRWDTEDEEKQFLPLVTDSGTVASIPKGTDFNNLRFSPDGKWLVYERINEDYRSPEFFAVAIDPANSLFLGKQYRLGRVLRPLDEGDHLGPSAWATEPTSFVVSDGKILYKWELDKLPR